MAILPFAEWTPDRPALAGGSVLASGVLPVTQSGYGPLAGPVASTSGPMLAGAGVPLPLNALSAISSAGDQIVVAGIPGATPKIKVFDVQAQTPWQDVTGSGVSANVPTWNFAQFKNTILACNGLNPLRQIIMPNGTSTGLTGAPASLYVAVTKDFAVIGYTYDPTNGTVPYRVWWSAYNDPTTWPTPGSPTAIADQSDYNDFDGSQGVIGGLTGSVLNADMIVFFEFGAQSGSYVGSPDVFNFANIATARGTRWPSSIVNVDGIAYYYGENGFYACDGINCVPIGMDKLDAFIANNWANVVLNGSGGNDRWVTGGYDPVSRCVFWMFTQLTVGAMFPVLLVFYHKEFSRWTYYQTSGFVTAFRGATVRANAAQYDIRRLLCTISPDGTVYSWNGSPVAAEMTTVEAQPLPNRRAWVKGARLSGDAGASATIAVATRLDLSAAQQFGADIPKDVSGCFPQRAEGRYVQAVVKVPAGATWTNLQGVEPDVQPSGSR